MPGLSCFRPQVLIDITVQVKQLYLVISQVLCRCKIRACADRGLVYLAHFQLPYKPPSGCGIQLCVCQVVNNLMFL